MMGSYSENNLSLQVGLWFWRTESLRRNLLLWECRPRPGMTRLLQNIMLGLKEPPKIIPGKLSCLNRKDYRSQGRYKKGEPIGSPFPTISRSLDLVQGRECGRRHDFGFLFNHQVPIFAAWWPDSCFDSLCSNSVPITYAFVRPNMNPFVQSSQFREHTCCHGGVLLSFGNGLCPTFN